jgi:thioredoxin-related protein
MKQFSIIALFVCAALWTRAADLEWQTDLTKALAKAKMENRTVLLNFMGDWSWCSDCKNFDAEVLKTATFQEYARTNFVLVELKETNQALEKKHDIHAWPTLILMDVKGEAIHKKIGYSKGEGAKAVIEEIELHRTKN